MWSRIRILSKAFGRVPSALFAILYLLSIPTFAYIYTNIQDGFYHSTVQYESVLDIDSNRILRRLRGEIIKQFKNKYGSTTIYVGEWIFNIENIRLYALKPKNTLLTFTLRTELKGAGKMKGVLNYTHVDVTLDAHIRMAVGFPGDPKRIIFTEPKLTPDTFEVPPDILFPSTNTLWRTATTKPVLAQSLR